LTFAQKKAHFRESYSDTSRGFSAGSQSELGGEKITPVRRRQRRKIPTILNHVFPRANDESSRQ